MGVILFGGAGPVIADKKACAALFALVEQQASTVALIRTFQYFRVPLLVLSEQNC